MLFFNGITKFFGSQVLFEGADFQINRKERVGLIGRNGSGKSTLLKLILASGQLDDGEIAYPERYQIGYLDQHLSFSQSTILDEVSLSLSSEERHQQWKSEKLLSGLGFDQNQMLQLPNTFSGGYQMRVKLAQLLLSEPDLLLLDEPTNYLDITSIRWLESFLRHWRHEILCVSHDHDFLHRICTHTAIIHRQKIKKIKGTPEKLFTQISLEEEVHEKTRKNDEKEQTRQEKFIREFRSGARSAGLVQSRIKMLDKKERLKVLPPIPQIRFSFPEKSLTGDRVFQLESVGFGYEKKKPLLDKFSCKIVPGDRIGIVGANGKGKTTLLRILDEQLIPQTGTIKRHPSLSIGYFGQSNVDKLDPSKTIIQEIQCQDQISEQQARGIAGSLLFSGGLAFKKIDVLSGGERARVNLGKILAVASNLLLLDEPTNHLDYESIEALILALERYSGTIVFVSHNEEFLRKIAKKLIVFDGEEVFWYAGSYDNFLAKKGFVLEHLEEKLIEDKPKKGDFPREQKKEIERKVRPLKRKIERLEKQIADLEVKQKKKKEDLSAAIRQGNLLAQDQCRVAVQEIEYQIQQAFDQASVIEQQMNDQTFEE